MRANKTEPVEDYLKKDKFRKPVCAVKLQFSDIDNEDALNHASNSLDFIYSELLKNHFMEDSKCKN